MTHIHIRVPHPHSIPAFGEAREPAAATRGATCARTCVLRVPCLSRIPIVGPKCANPTPGYRGPTSTCGFLLRTAGVRVWGCDSAFAFGFRMLVVISDFEVVFTTRVAKLVSELRCPGFHVVGSKFGTRLRNTTSEPEFGNLIRNNNSGTGPGTRRRRRRRQRRRRGRRRRQQRRRRKRRRR